MDVDDNVDFRQTSGRNRWAAAIAIVLIIVAFTIGILIGFFGIRKPESKVDKRSPGPCTESIDKKAVFQKQREQVKEYHENFQGTLSEEQLENTLK